MSGVVVVTGASRGIGRATTELLAGEGWRVIAIARPSPELEALRDVPGCRVAELDLAGERPERELSAVLDDEGASLDGVVSSAGALDPLSPLMELTSAALRRLFEVNVVSALSVLHACKPRMSPGSRFVAVGTSALDNQGAFATMGGYLSTKAAFEQLHRVAAVEWAEQLDIVILRLGLVDTGMYQAIRTSTDAKKQRYDAAEARGAVSSPARVAAAISRLLTAQTAFEGRRVSLAEAETA